MTPENMASRLLVRRESGGGAEPGASLSGVSGRVVNFDMHACGRGAFTDHLFPEAKLKIWPGNKNLVVALVVVECLTLHMLALAHLEGRGPAVA